MLSIMDLTERRENSTHWMLLLFLWEVQWMATPLWALMQHVISALWSKSSLFLSPIVVEFVLLLFTLTNHILLYTLPSHTPHTCSYLSLSWIKMTMSLSFKMTLTLLKWLKVLIGGLTQGLLSWQQTGTKMPLAVYPTVWPEMRVSVSVPHTQGNNVYNYYPFIMSSAQRGSWTARINSCTWPNLYVIGLGSNCLYSCCFYLYNFLSSLLLWPSILPILPPLPTTEYRQHFLNWFNHWYADSQQHCGSGIKPHL